MAAATAGCETAVRLRLLFDYPPPGTPSYGLCWLLLEPSQVRLVTDLISLIRDKFGFSRRAHLSLFLDGALLPPAESARLVRDNDSLRVKLEDVIREDCCDEIANGFGNQSRKQRKRHRQKMEAKVADSEDEDQRKRKKSKCSDEHLSSQEENATVIHDQKTLKKMKNVTERDHIADSRSDDSTCPSTKPKKKPVREKEKGAASNKKKKKGKTLETNNTLQQTSKTLSPSKKSTAKTTVAQSSTKTAGTSSESSTSSDDTDHTIADKKQNPSYKTKVASQHIKTPHLASSVKSAAKQRDSNCPNTAYSKKAKSPSSSSDSDSSPGEQEEQPSSNLRSKFPCNNQVTVTGPTSRANPKISSAESESSSESETCAIKKPKTNSIVKQSLGGDGGRLVPAVSGRPAANPSDSGRGRGRGENPFWRGPRVRGCRGMIKGWGRGRGENTNFLHNYNGEQQMQQQLNEAATNTSVIIQNPPEVPKKDYSILPLLAAPPQVGEKIAFKRLELTEDYSPEVSDYKEGKIVSWDPANKQIELEIISFSSASKEPGKFDLVYQSADGAETVEYAVSQDRKITEIWDTLIEPRLIVEPIKNEASTANGNP